MKILITSFFVLIASICNAQCANKVVFEINPVLPQHATIHIDTAVTPEIIKLVEGVEGVDNTWVENDKYKIQVEIGLAFYREKVFEKIMELEQ